MYTGIIHSVMSLFGDHPSTTRAVKVSEWAEKLGLAPIANPRNIFASGFPPLFPLSKANVDDITFLHMGRLMGRDTQFLEIPFGQWIGLRHKGERCSVVTMRSEFSVGDILIVPDDLLGKIGFTRPTVGDNVQIAAFRGQYLVTASNPRMARRLLEPEAAVQIMKAPRAYYAFGKNLGLTFGSEFGVTDYQDAATLLSTVLTQMEKQAGGLTKETTVIG